MLVERLSWIAIVVGFPIAIYQVIMLRGEQRRVAHELARRPEVLIGFYPFTESHGKKILQHETDITATWQPGNPMSDPVEFTIVCYNAGERTARNVLYNFKFERQFEYLTKISKPAEHGRFVKSPDDGRPLWLIVGNEHIHPEDSAPFTTAISIPQRTPFITINADVSMDDRPSTRAQLKLRVIVHPPKLT